MVMMGLTMSFCLSCEWIPFDGMIWQGFSCLFISLGAVPSCPEAYLNSYFQISLSSSSDFFLFLQFLPILNTITTQWEKSYRNGHFSLRSPALFSCYSQREGFSDAFESKSTFLKLFILSEQCAVTWRTIWLVWEGNVRIAQKEGHFGFCISNFSRTNINKDSELQTSKCFDSPFEVLVSWILPAGTNSLISILHEM